MIRNTRQSWQEGETVKVGFLTLEVVKAIPTPGDYKPDAYVLWNRKDRFYRFTPHHGLERCASLQEAMAP